MGSVGCGGFTWGDPGSLDLTNTPLVKKMGGMRLKGLQYSCVHVLQCRLHNANTIINVNSLISFLWGVRDLKDPYLHVNTSNKV